MFQLILILELDSSVAYGQKATVRSHSARAICSTGRNPSHGTLRSRKAAAGGCSCASKAVVQAFRRAFAATVPCCALSADWEQGASLQLFLC